MPFIQDEQPQFFAAQPPPPHTQVNHLNTSAAVLPAGYAISTAAACSCVRDANGAVTHLCTTASYTSQAVVPPPQDPAFQKDALKGVGGLFDELTLVVVDGEDDDIMDA